MLKWESLFAGTYSPREYPSAAQWSGEKLGFSDFWTGPSSKSPQNYLLYPPTPSSPAVREWTQEEEGRGRKAWAHRFAIFNHNFSVLLLHKKRRIPDYLWHSETVRVDTQWIKRGLCCQYGCTIAMVIISVIGGSLGTVYACFCCCHVVFNTKGDIKFFK